MATIDITKNHRSNLPLVSVIVPVYNSGATLVETLNSVCCQTYQNIEIIVVDDGSSDQMTLDVLGEISKDIKVMHQVNKGSPAARNAGIAASKGKYIICLDSDDCLNKKYIEKIVKRFTNISNPKIAIISSYVQAFGMSNEQWTVPEFDLNKIKYSNVLPIASAFTKKVWKTVGGYDDGFRHGYEDWDFWLLLVENGYEWAVIKEPIFYYRRQKRSMITSANERRQELYAKIIKKHASLYSREEDSSILGKMLGAEVDRMNYKKLSVSYLRKIFSMNFFKRFKVFR